MPIRHISLRLTAAVLAATAAAVIGAHPAATAEHEVIAVRQRFVSGSGPSCRADRDGTNTMRVATNDVVGWTNCTFDNHTVTFDDGRHDAVIAPGQRTTRRFPSSGTYSYFCRIHNDAGMTGRVVVETPSPSPRPGSSANSPTTARSTARPPTTRSAAPTTRPSDVSPAAPAASPTTTTAAIVFSTPRSTVPAVDTALDHLEVVNPSDDRPASSPSAALRMTGWVALAAASIAALVATRRRPPA